MTATMSAAKEPRTIRELLNQIEIGQMTDRLVKMEKMNAPSGLIDSLRKSITEAKDQGVKIGGDQSLLDLIYEGDGAWNKGRGGKPFLTLNRGTINYFPMARFGHFIAKAE